MDKNPAAVALGKLGGKARSLAMSKDERVASAKRASTARWGNPPKCACGLMTLDRAAKRNHVCK